MMRVSTSLLLVLGLVSSVAAKPDETPECKLCAKRMYKRLLQCAETCAEIAALISDDDPSVLLKQCQTRCGNEIDFCLGLGACTGTTCDPQEWLLTGTIAGGGAGKAIGAFDLALASDGVIAAFDVNHYCDNDVPGDNCKGGVNVYQEDATAVGNWAETERYEGAVKSENFGRYLAISDDASVLAIGGYQKWVIEGRGPADKYQCEITTSHSEVSGYTVAVSRNGKYVALGKFSARGDTQLRVMKYRPELPPKTQGQTPCPWKQKGETFVGGDYDFGYISISNDGNHVVYGNHDPRLGPNDDGAYMLIYRKDSKTWEKVADHIAGNGAMDLGSAVEISADASTVAVGFPGGLHLDTGAMTDSKVKVFQFDEDTEAFEWIGLILATTTYLGNWLSLSKNGKFLAVSSGPSMDEFPNGVARVYKKAQENYQLLKEFTGEAYGDGFGKAAVSLSSNGRRFVVAASGSDSTYNDAGKIYVYDNCGWRNGWIAIKKSKK